MQSDMSVIPSEARWEAETGKPLQAPGPASLAHTEARRPRLKQRRRLNPTPVLHSDPHTHLAYMPIFTHTKQLKIIFSY